MEKELEKLPKNQKRNIIVFIILVSFLLLPVLFYVAKNGIFKPDAYYARNIGDVNVTELKGAIIIGKQTLQETNGERSATDEYVSIQKAGTITTHLYIKSVWQNYRVGDTIGVTPVHGDAKQYKEYLENMRDENNRDVERDQMGYIIKNDAQRREINRNKSEYQSDAIK